MTWTSDDAVAIEDIEDKNLILEDLYVIMVLSQKLLGKSGKRKFFRKEVYWDNELSRKDVENYREAFQTFQEHWAQVK